MNGMRRSGYRWVLPFLLSTTFLFLYIHIVILVLFSFNKSDLPFAWEGWSLRWYAVLWKSPEIWQALMNSITVGLCSVVLSLTLGLLYVFYSRHSFMRGLQIIFYTSLATPEIVLAVGLLTFFAFFSVPLGLTTLIAGHALIGLGYVIPILQSRFDELDKGYMEAALDLGATESQALRKVIMPLLMPALFASALLVFIVSLDDFIISFFCSGGATQTLPIYIFVMIRSGTSSVVNALSTILLVVSSILVIIFSSLNIKKMELMQ